MLEKIDLLKIMKQYPNALNNPKVMEGILKDNFPANKGEVNILLCAVKAGIQNEIARVENVDVYVATRLVNKLVNEYGISEQNAQWAVMTWCEGLEREFPDMLKTVPGIAAAKSAAQTELNMHTNCNDSMQALLDKLNSTGDTSELLMKAGITQWDAAHCLYELGRKCEKENNNQRAFQLYIKAAELGHSYAQYSVGMIYGTGEGTARDSQKAAEWLEKAAEQDHTDAQYYLGLMYDLGEGVEQDPVEAAVWLTEAAEQGHGDAQYCLGLMYEAGRGVCQDFGKAVEWFSKAANQGNLSAAALLRELWN